jgi:hypothetical protein
MAYAPSAGAASWGKRGITVGDFETRNCVVTAYAARHWRQFQEDGQVVTRAQIRMNIRQNEGPPDRRTNFAVINFGSRDPGDSHQIGSLEKRTDPHVGEFQFDVTLPVAEFDHYWNILTCQGQSQLNCTVEPIHGVDISQFELTSAKLPETGTD